MCSKIAKLMDIFAYLSAYDHANGIYAYSTDSPPNLKAT